MFTLKVDGRRFKTNLTKRVFVDLEQLYGIDAYYSIAHSIVEATATRKENVNEVAERLRNAVKNYG